MKNKTADLKNFKKPDETREFPFGKLELIRVDEKMIGKITCNPGWRWATSVQPVAKTKSCEATHFQYQISGVMRVKMDDGTEFDCKAGDVTCIPPGHDAWVVGDEPVVAIDFQGMAEYAKSK